MRSLDNSHHWYFRFGEFSIIDDNKSYALVVGLVDGDDEDSEEPTTYIRLYDEQNRLIIGTWLNQLKYKAYSTERISNNLKIKCIELAKQCEPRIKSMKVFI